MMDLEQIIDEIANRLKSGRDISLWQNSHQLSPITNLLSKLTTFPKLKLPTLDSDRVKNQILDRIAHSAEIVTVPRGFFTTLASFLKLSSGVIGTLLIVISLGIGTGAAALQSEPGQPMYPLKKVVENIELKLTRDPAARANLQIQFANTRLEELATVIEKNQAGEISSYETQKIVTQTVSDLQKSTAAALSSSAKSSSSKQVSALNKLVTLSNKQEALLKPLISAANITTDGQVKIVLEQALQTSIISKEEAIKNIENAGLKVEDQPITIDTANKISANGKITAISADTVSIGTAKFLLTKDTEYVNIKSADLKLGLAIKISGEVQSDKKTYALTVSAASPEQETVTPKPSTDSKPTETKPNTDTTAQP